MPTDYRQQWEQFLEELNEVRRTEEDLRCFKAELPYLKAAAERTTGRLDAMPRGSGGSGSLQERYVCALESYRSRRAAADLKKSGLYDLLSRIPDRRVALIMKLRYVHGQSWDEIRASLPDYGLYCSERSLFRLHRQGLEAAFRLYTAPESRAA